MILELEIKHLFLWPARPDVLQWTLSQCVSLSVLNGEETDSS